jgi:hypothetical protein
MRPDQVAYCCWQLMWRRDSKQQGELDVLLLMLCIQCKKMYTVWVQFTRRWKACSRPRRLPL